MAAATGPTSGSVVIASPILSEASDAKAGPHVGVQVDHRSSLHTPLVSAAAVTEWKGDKTGRSLRGWCSGPDGTSYRCLDARPTSATGWWALFFANLVSYIAMIAINALAATGSLLADSGAISVSEVSSLCVLHCTKPRHSAPHHAPRLPRYNTAITPAGWAFSIWGLIFTLDALFIIAQGLDQDVRVAASVPHLWLMIGITSWILAWCNEALLLSCFFMFLGVLAPLLVLYHTIGEAAVVRAHTALGALSTRVMVSVFTGCITVASIVNVAATGTPRGGAGGGEWGASNYARVMLTVAMSLGCLMLTLRRDVAFTAVLVWALMAISDHQGAGSGNPGDEGVSVMARTYAICLGLGCILAILPRCNWAK